MSFGCRTGTAAGLHARVGHRPLPMRLNTTLCLMLGLCLLRAVAADDDDLQWNNRSMPYAVFDKLPATRVGVGGAVIDVAFAPGETDLPKSRILDWIAACAHTVAAYYGHFPAKRLRLLIIPEDGGGVRHGTSFGYAGAAIKVALGRSVSERELAKDWVLIHEMVHLAFPSQARQHLWIEEGVATYVEPVARAQAGRMPAEDAWRQLVRGLPQGLPGAGDEGLDHTHTWGRTYWGGALFCLLAELDIRRRTDNRYGLQDALRAISDATGGIEMEWPLEKVLRIGDGAIGVPALSELYDKMKAAPVDTDLDGLWQRLGIAVKDGEVMLNDDAPLARVRRAITAPRSDPRKLIELHTRAGR